MEINLSGKRIIVTGGATGIGRASSLRVSRDGAKVALFDIKEEDSKKASDAIRSSGGEARVWNVDVGDEDVLSRAVSEAEAWLGGIDSLLHFAGVLWGASVELDEFPEETWDAVLDTNLRGSYLMAKYVVAVMKKQQSGVIILAASGAVVRGGSSSYAYGSSKRGVHGLTMVMQTTLPKYGIRVNDIAPGSVKSPLKIGQMKSSAERTGSSTNVDQAIENLNNPEDVANIVAFMVSDQAKLLRGTVFTG